MGGREFSSRSVKRNGSRNCNALKGPDVGHDDDERDSVAPNSRGDCFFLFLSRVTRSEERMNRLIKSDRYRMITHAITFYEIVCL